MLSDLTARLGEIRTDWNLDEVEALFALPFNDLLFHAQRVHRQYFDPNSVQVSTLLSIKTGACPEDCAYCPQSVRFDTGLEPEALLAVEEFQAGPLIYQFGVRPQQQSRQALGSPERVASRASGAWRRK